MKYLTASKLQDYLICPHRIWRDEFGPLEEKEKKTNPFVELLWNKGVLKERAVIKHIGPGNYLDLDTGEHWKERFKNTLQAIEKGVPLIYQGVLHFENMIGIPDLLQKTAEGDYIPIDIKSARGCKQVGHDTRQLKKQYVVQLCMYIELLQKLRFTRCAHGYIYDIDDKLIPYDSNQPISKRNRKTWYQFYLETKQIVLELMSGQRSNRPALAADCGLCSWSESCACWCKKTDDLTNIFYLGRSKRKILNRDLGITTVREVKDIDVDTEIEKKQNNKKHLHKIARKTLTAIQRRSNVLTCGNEPLVYKKYELPVTKYELFFDIEDDPTQGLIYLHGFYEYGTDKSRFVYFIAEKNNKQGEKMAWKEALDYIFSFSPEEMSLYYYSRHERTVYKKLQQIYPDLASGEKIEELFGRKNTIDLYSDIIYKSVDWPLSHYSLKDIASYVGFKWRDESPSGALSILWYYDYLQSKDKKILQRIIDYNEDDCKATMAIKRALEQLKEKKLPRNDVMAQE